MIHIGLVEDDDNARNLLALFLEQHNMQVSSAGTLGAFRQLMKNTDQPLDIVLLDLNLPDEDGITIINTLRNEQNLGIIVISSRASEESKVAAISLGADDYLTKPYSFNELLVRIRALVRRLQSTPQHNPYKEMIDQLSKREQTVLSAIASGDTLQSIADRLNISIKTVETYRSRIAQKLNVRNIAEITRIAVMAGMIE